MKRKPVAQLPPPTPPCVETPFPGVASPQPRHNHPPPPTGYQGYQGGQYHSYQGMQGNYSQGGYHNSGYPPDGRGYQPPGPPNHQGNYQGGYQQPGSYQRPGYAPGQPGYQQDQFPVGSNPLCQCQRLTLPPFFIALSLVFFKIVDYFSFFVPLHIFISLLILFIYFD